MKWIIVFLSACFVAIVVSIFNVKKPNQVESVRDSSNDEIRPVEKNERIRIIVSNHDNTLKSELKINTLNNQVLFQIGNTRTFLKEDEVNKFLASLSKGRSWIEKLEGSNIKATKAVSAFGRRIAVIIETKREEPCIVIALKDVAYIYLDKIAVNSLIDRIKQLPIEKEHQRIADEILK